jgi:hypothetical protein
MLIRTVPFVKLILLWISISSLFSCGQPPMFYRPNVHNVALLQKQGDAQFSGSVGTWGGNGHISFALTDHIGLQMNATKLDKSRSGGINEGSEKNIEAGLGFQAMVYDSVHIELYGLLGSGEMENMMLESILFTPITYGTLKAQVDTRSLQGAVTYFGKWSSISLSSRLRHVHFSQIEGDLVYNRVNQQQFLRNNATQLYFEPALTLRLGTPRLQFSLQCLLSANLRSSELYHPHAAMSVGIHYYLR